MMFLSLKYIQIAACQHRQPCIKLSASNTAQGHPRLLLPGRLHGSCSPGVRASSTAESAGLDDDYNASMQRQMGWESNPYEYHYDRGLYYHEVWPSLFCGTQPRNIADVDKLAQLLGPKGSILSLQQDKDLEYWGVNLHDIQSQTHQRELTYLRTPAQDFDPHSLRNILPGAVKAIQEELSKGRRVYVHCTAGLGRAPAACIAYMYWFQDFQLEGAYKHLTDVRPCGPKKDAIRGATFDLLDGRPWEGFQHLPPFSYSELNQNDKDRLQDKILNHT